MGSSRSCFVPSTLNIWKGGGLGGRPPATPRAHPKIAFFQSTIPPTTPSHGTCGENELGEVGGGGVSLGWRSTCKCAHTRTHTHTPADRTRTQKDAFIPILEVQTVAPQACPPTHPPLAWGHVDGAAMVAAPELGHHRAHCGPLLATGSGAAPDQAQRPRPASLDRATGSRQARIHTR